MIIGGDSGGVGGDNGVGYREGEGLRCRGRGEGRREGSRGS